MNRKKIAMIAATGNPNKLREMKTILSEFGIDVVSEKEAGLGQLEVEETGSTFEENSYIKAEAVMKASGKSAIADDSGLAVDALDGAPGIYSARFSGEGATDEKNNRKLLSLMADVPNEKRTACFVSVITVCFTDGSVLTARGECPGRVLREPAGKGGFGYDPLFVPDGYDKTFAELDSEVKNKMSHRARALARLREKLTVYLNEKAKAE